MEFPLRKLDSSQSLDEDGHSSPSSRDQSQRDGSADGEVASGCQNDAAKHCPQKPTFENAISYSMGAIPVDVGQRERRTTGRTLSGQTASYHGDGYGKPSEPLPRLYASQSKTCGYAPKEIIKSMGTIALPREEPPMSTGMAKGDAGRQVPQGHGPMTPLMPAHGMSRNLPKQSYFRPGDAYYVDCPSRTDACLQEGLQQRPDAYDAPQPDTRGEYHRKLSLLPTFKPRCADKSFDEQYTAEQQPEMATEFYKEVESRKKQWATGGGYPGDPHCSYDGRRQGQQYAVHVVQESGRNDAFREAGDTGTDKSSADSSLKFITVPADLTNMFVNVCDAMTGGDTPLPQAVTRMSTMETSAILNDGANEDDKESASSSSAASAGSSDSKSEFKAECEHKSGSEHECDAALNVTYTIEPYDDVPTDALLAEVRSVVQQPPEREPEPLLRKPLQQCFQQQYPLAPIFIPPEYANHQEAYQKYILQYYTGQAYRQSYQPAQQMMNYQQEHTNPQMGQDERDAYAALRNVGNNQVPLSMPGEEPESNAALSVTYTLEPYDEATTDAPLPAVHSVAQQPPEQEPETLMRKPLQQSFQHQYPLAPIHIPPEYANPQEAYQNYLLEYYTGQAYRQSYQPAQQMMSYQQEHTNPQIAQDERDAYAAPRNVENNQVPLRMPREEPESNAALSVTYTLEPYEEAATDAPLPEVQSVVQQPPEQESEMLLRKPLQQSFQQQYPLAPLHVPPEYANPYEAYQRYVRQYYTGQAYRQSYQPVQQMINLQQEHTNPQMGQDERDDYAAPRNVGNNQLPLRMPDEGASLRTVRSQSSEDIGDGETGEDNSSLQSHTIHGDTASQTDPSWQAQWE